MKKRRAASMILALAMVLTVLPLQAFAAETEAVTIIKYAKQDVDDSGAKLNIQNIKTVPSGTVKNLKSSDTSIATVTTKKIDNVTYIYAKAKRAGTTTVSYKCNGQKYKIKVTVRKYVNPVKSIKIGSKTIKSSKFANTANYTLKYSKFKNQTSKVTINLKSGWTLDPIYYYFYYQKGWSKSDMIANKGKVTIAGGKGAAIFFWAVNDSTGQRESIYLFFK